MTEDYRPPPRRQPEFDAEAAANEIAHLRVVLSNLLEKTVGGYYDIEVIGAAQRLLGLASAAPAVEARPPVLDPAYVELTGATRLRPALFGRLVVQVESRTEQWTDATEINLIGIGFKGSSWAGRRRDPFAPPVDWDKTTNPRLAWL